MEVGDYELEADVSQESEAETLNAVFLVEERMRIAELRKKKAGKHLPLYKAARPAAACQVKWPTGHFLHCQPLLIGNNQD